MNNDDSLNDCIVRSMRQYFNDLNGETPINLYKFFINEVEKPFLTVVMQHVNGNQSQATKLLGINRNTLRKKLKQYQLD